MEGKNYICGNTKYRFSKGYIGLPIRPLDLAKTIKIGGRDLTLKSTFHVSLVCVKNIIAQYGTEIEDKILKIFCEFVEKEDLNFESFTGEIRYAKDNGKETLVAMCNISHIDDLFVVLRRELNIQIETPPTHVTLYTLQPEVGIGINNTDDLKNKTSVIDNPILREILK